LFISLEFRSGLDLSGFLRRFIFSSLVENDSFNGGETKILCFISFCFSGNFDFSFQNGGNFLAEDSWNFVRWSDLGNDWVFSYFVEIWFKSVGFQGLFDFLFSRNRSFFVFYGLFFSSFLIFNRTFIFDGVRFLDAVLVIHKKDDRRGLTICYT